MGRMRRMGVLGAVAAVVLAAPALAAPAELDTTYGDGGVTRVTMHEGDGFTFVVSDVVTEADGSAVLLGGVLRSEPLDPVTGAEFDLAFARLGPDGRLDEGFGIGGVVRLDLGGLDFPARLDLDGQGRVLFSANQVEGSNTQGIAGRLAPDGSLDATFGDGGLVRVGGAPIVFVGELAVDAADRPALAVLAAEEETDASARAEVRRLTVTGAPDATFGNAGTARVIGTRAGAFGLEATPDGYLVSGAVTPTGPFVARVDDAGRLDASFGDGGVRTVDVPGGVALTVGVTEDGGLVAGGTVGMRTGLVLRFTSAGAVVPGFGLGGVRTVRADDAGAMPLADVGVGPSGSLVLAGPQLDASPHAVVARLLASGAEDAGFGGDGYVRPVEDEALEASVASAVTVDAEGRAVVAGLAVSSEAALDAFAARLRSTATGAAVTTRAAARAAGPDRIATAIALARRAFTEAADAGGRNASSVVLAAANRYPDALVAAPYAAATNGPLLLNPTERLDARVRDEIARLLPDGGVVTLMGGFAAIGVGVEAELRGAGYSVQRIAGADRYETSVRVAESMASSSVVLARGDAFPDALAAGPAAAEIGGAVLLTAGSEIPPSVRSHLDARGDDVVYAVGGKAAAAAPEAIAIVGTDRYDTAARVALRFFTTPPRTVVASGETFPDALAGGTLAALTGSPLLLATRDALPAVAARTLRRGLGFHRQVTLAGGTSVLTDRVLAETRSAIG